MKLNEKLATIQTKFKSKKSRFNSFGKYYFRSAEDILEATKPFLLEHGVTIIVNEVCIGNALRPESFPLSNVSRREVRMGPSPVGFTLVCWWVRGTDGTIARRIFRCMLVDICFMCEA